jgi:hypothetical protein
MQFELNKIYVVSLVDDNSAYVEAFETEQGALRFASLAARVRGYEVAEFKTRLALVLWINENNVEFNCEVHEKFLNK